MRVDKTLKFEKELDKISENNTLSFRTAVKERLKEFIKCKIQGIPLPPDYKDHKLNKNKQFKDCRDAHLKGDTVVIYQEDDEKVVLLRIGNHNNLLENLLER